MGTAENHRPTTKFTSRNLEGDGKAEGQSAHGGYRAILIGPSEQVVVPHSVMCVVKKCGGHPSTGAGAGGIDGTAGNPLPTPGPPLHCPASVEGRNEVMVFVAVEKEGQRDSASSHAYDERTLRDLEDRCIARLDAAVTASRADGGVSATDFQSMRRRQMMRFSTLMGRVHLHLPTSEARARPGGDSPSGVATAVDLFDFGRYLMLISGQRALSNLQGVWADGPRSAWAGDYHMNINLQMNHWAAPAVGLGRLTSQPLSAFVGRLRASGTRTAQQFYQCKGWVAHGFTDEYLDTGTSADYHWALCVTCGAWVALTLWDYSSYLPLSNEGEFKLRAEVLSALAGVADFFLDYLALDSRGTRHTGPTTSPENSYLLLNPHYRPGGTAAAPPADGERSGMKRGLLATQASQKDSAGRARPPPQPLDELEALEMKMELEHDRDEQEEEQEMRREEDHLLQLELDLTERDPNFLKDHPEIAKMLEEDRHMEEEVAAMEREEESRQGSAHRPHAAAGHEAEHSKVGGKQGPSRRGSSGGPKYIFAQLSMSPAIDMSILRQAALAYEYTLFEISHSPGTGTDTGADSTWMSSVQIEEHRDRAARFQKAVGELPNSGLPVIDPTSGHVYEHPTHFRSDQNVAMKMRTSVPSVYGEYSDTESTPAPAREHADEGHRHYSGMHFLYPNVFAPSFDRLSSSIDTLKRACEDTLRAKREDGGGHAGWSAAWEASLWARVQHGDDAWQALKRFIAHYTTPRLLGLHPRLEPRNPDCKTCFRDPTLPHNEHLDRNFLETHRTPAGRARPKSGRTRGLSTADDSLFQIDGNLGLVAGVVEMLVQSHVPGRLNLLPALPKEWSSNDIHKQGRVQGLLARGDILVESLVWVGTEEGGPVITAARLTFRSDHRWHSFQLNEVFQAFDYRYNEGDNIHSSYNESLGASAVDNTYAYRLHISGPSGQAFTLVGSHSCVKQGPSLAADSLGGIDVTILSFPCTIDLQ
jgi:hypothetical protein